MSRSGEGRQASRPAHQVVCHCAGVTAGQIRAAAGRSPDVPWRELCRELGCAMQCGSCQPEVLQTLGLRAWWPAAWRSTVLSTGRTADEAERTIHRVQLTLAAGAGYPLARAGQHVVIRAAQPGGAVQRSFTIVAQDALGGHLELAVRRVPGGQFTPQLLDAPGPVAVEISAPGGEGFALDHERPQVFFAGGIGITPAISLFRALPPGAQGRLDWSIAQPGDAVLAQERLAIAARHPALNLRLRDSSREGRLDGAEVRRVAGQHAGACFHVCGPPGYVALVQGALGQAGVPAADVRVETFSVPRASLAGVSRALSWRWKSYAAGLLLAGATGVMLSQTPQELRPHGPHNPGHEKLSCVSCHDPAAGSTRQVLQAKAHHQLGLRESSAAFGKQPVSNSTCLQCHANFDDRHAPSRFLEPRFEQARAELGVHQCMSCHREHQGVRVTAAQPGFCVSCHQDLKLPNDRTSPTHEALVRGKQWGTCLQCHDYHGNHHAKPPLRLDEGLPLARIAAYFAQAPSPYGEPVIKAKPPTEQP